ncbi:MAG: metal-binding protein [Eggerthellaceae bacterium]|nr:metal-binding protein [Eggerthellaceae bacterium]
MLVHCGNLPQTKGCALQSEFDPASFFANEDCPYFPCHKGVARERFNCLFCYCPLYTLGSECPGECTYLENGIKDCSSCIMPHDGAGFADVVVHYWPKVNAIASDRQ